MQDILDFWFGLESDPNYGKPQQYWFSKNTTFDQEVRSRFLPIYEQARTGKLDTWQESPQGSLALIIVLDQFPRNMFRNQPQAFATDNQALDLAQQAINQGFDQLLLPVQRWFIYLPFEHSENLEHQHYCVQLFSNLPHDSYSASVIDYAQRHLDIIAKFGRFPHRNAILRRESTPEELDFLQQSDSAF